MWTDVVLALATAALAAGTLGTLIVFGLQLRAQGKALGEQRVATASNLREMGRHADLVARTAWASVYQGIADQMMSIDRYMLDHADVRNRFYGGAPDTAHVQQDRLEALAEMFVDFADNLIVQARNLGLSATYPDHTYLWGTWANYFHDIYQQSPILRAYLERHRNWYLSDVATMFEEGIISLNNSSVGIASAQAMRQLDDHDSIEHGQAITGN